MRTRSGSERAAVGARSTGGPAEVVVIRVEALFDYRPRGSTRLCFSAAGWPDDKTVNSNPTVSVVINFLNAEPYLSEAIESVRAQTLGDWELLLVDDGSTDGSTDVAKACARENGERVRYLQHDGHANRGASASRNLGMRHARGEYLAYLDADDVWLPRKLEEQVALLAGTPGVAMVYGPAWEWASWTGRPKDGARDRLRDIAVPAGTILRPPQMLELFLGDQGAVPAPSGVLVRTAFLRGVGGSEDDCRSIYDDQILYAKLGLEGSVLVSDRVWYKYRLHPAQRVRLALRAGDGPAVREKYLRWLRGYLVAKGLDEGPAWVAVGRELRPFTRPLSSRIERLRYAAKRVKVLLAEAIFDLTPAFVVTRRARGLDPSSTTPPGPR